MPRRPVWLMMVVAGDGSQARIGAVLPVPARLAVGVSILAVASIVLVVYGGPVPAADTGDSTLPFGTPLSAQTCAQLESPTNLSLSLAGLYNGFSLQGYQAGPNGTPALGINAYPNLSVGQAALISSWSSICSGGQFGYAYAHANGTAGFFSGGALAGDGHYVFFYGFNWGETCPPRLAGSPYPCEATATWTVDLVTDQLTGPSFTVTVATPLGAP